MLILNEHCVSRQVAQVEKFSENSGLGISLDADDGHHYICSVLPDGPVGRSGKLFSGDELLEVRASPHTHHAWTKSAKHQPKI